MPFMIDARDYPFDFAWGNLTDSTSAMAALIHDCNTNHVPADFSHCYGQLNIIGNAGTWFNGTALLGPWSTPDGLIVGDPSSSRSGLVIAIRKMSGMASGVGATVPWASFAAGSGCRGVTFWQPDQVTSTIDAGSDPLIYDSSVATALLDPDNAPDIYPPVIVTNHNVTAMGLGTTPTSRFKFTRGRFEDIGLNGVYAGLHFIHDVPPGEYDPDDPDTGQKQATDIRCARVRGWCLRNDLTLGQSGTVTRLDDFDISPVFYAPYLQEGGVGGVRKAMRWARENKESVVLDNRAVGLRLNILTRVARRALVIRGGYVEGSDPYRGGLAGRVNQSAITVGVEQVPNIVTVERDGSLHAVNLTVSGLAVNRERPDFAAPVVDLQTNRDIAGSMTHQTPPQFVAMGSARGWRVNLILNVGQACGSVLHVASTDGHDVINCTGSVGSWGVADKTQPAFNLDDGCRAILKINAMTIFAFAGQILFRVPSERQLRVSGATEVFGGINPPVVNLPQINHRDPQVFAADTKWYQEGFASNGDVLDDEDDL